MSLFNIDKLLFGKRYAEELAPFEKTKNKYWDPSNLVEIRRAEKNTRHIAWQYEQIRANPKKVRRRLRRLNLLILPAVILTFIPGIGIFFLFAALALGGIAWGAVRSIAVDIAKYAVLKEKDWLYDPAPNYQKGQQLAKEIPEIFVNGDGKHTEDEFWGTLPTNNISVYGGEYSYTQGSGKNKTTYFRHFFMCKLPNKLPAYFKLGPELPTPFGLGRGKEIDVESIAFNKKFKFYYKGRKDEQAPKILKLLTPSIQLHLMELANKKRGTTVLFKGDMLVFMFNNRLMRKRSTKILIDGKVSQDDINFFDDYLKDATAIAQELSKRLA